jgi:hypothetical protein
VYRKISFFFFKKKDAGRGNLVSRNNTFTGFIFFFNTENWQRQLDLQVIAMVRICGRKKEMGIRLLIFSHILPTVVIPSLARIHEKARDRS